MCEKEEGNAEQDRMARDALCLVETTGKRYTVVQDLAGVLEVLKACELPNELHFLEDCRGEVEWLAVAVMSAEQ